MCDIRKGNHLQKTKLKTHYLDSKSFGNTVFKVWDLTLKEMKESKPLKRTFQMGSNERLPKNVLADFKETIHL